MQRKNEKNVPDKYISFSRLELVTQCPAKFKHRYILESKGRTDTSSPAVLGSIVHKTLELAYLQLMDEGFSGALKPRKDLFLKYLKQVIQSENHPPELFIQAQEMVKDFADTETFQCENTIAVEQQFVFEPDTLGEITILGYIDRIDRPNYDTVILVDYKTNRMLYTAEELKQSLQASIYIMAAKEMFPQAEHFEMRFHMLRHGIQQRTLRTEHDLAEAREYILLVNGQIRKIENGGEAPADQTLPS